MNFAGGVRWTIMQNKERLAFARFQDALIDVPTVPGLELLRLVLREAGFHGKFGFRQVQRFLEFEWFGHIWSACKSLLCRPLSSGARRETSESSVRTYVTMNDKSVSAARGAQPFPASANLIGLVRRTQGSCV